MSVNILITISPSSPDRLRGIAEAAQKRGWHLMVQSRLLHRLDGWSGDGALVTVRSEDEIRLVRRLRRKGIPVVDLTIEHPELRLPRVIGDHAEIGRCSARFFADRRFAHIAWFSSDWTHVHALRFGGLCEVWEGEPPIRWVFSQSGSGRRADHWPSLVRWLGGQLAAAPKPLAVVTYDDSDAARVEHIALARGLAVPEEIAILGIGNDTLLCENQQVPLSSVRHDTEEAGRRGVALLEELMSEPHRGAPPCLLVSPRGVVERASTDVIAVEDPLLAAALGYISLHLAESFGLAQIADALGVSPSRIQSAFTAGLQCRVGDEIRRQRLARVRLLLENTTLTVSEIADQTGFQHLSHLSMLFRKTTGLTPSAWRAAHARQ